MKEEGREGGRKEERRKEGRWGEWEEGRKEKG